MGGGNKVDHSFTDLILGSATSGRCFLEAQTRLQPWVCVYETVYQSPPRASFSERDFKTVFLEARGPMLGARLQTVHLGTPTTNERDF